MKAGAYCRKAQAKRFPKRLPLRASAATARLPEATAMHSSPVSPPPFMVGMAEIELDRETGVVEVLNLCRCG